jgi:hypothetical protein
MICTNLTPPKHGQQRFVRLSVHGLETLFFATFSEANILTVERMRAVSRLVTQIMRVLSGVVYFYCITHNFVQLLHDPLAFSHPPLSLRCFPTPEFVPFLGNTTRSSNFEPNWRLGNISVVTTSIGVSQPFSTGNRKNTCVKMCSRVCSKTDRKKVSKKVSDNPRFGHRKAFSQLSSWASLYWGKQHSGFTPL